MPKTRLRVFVSYSRKDEHFVQDLVSGLQADGSFEVLVDTEDVVGGEIWRRRISELILKCDTMVFVLSPDSVASKECVWEVAEANRFGRRLIPVVYRPVDFGLVPPGLSSRNAIALNDNNTLRGARELITVLKTDVDWLRDFSTLSERAEEWRAQGQTDDRLLVGNALSEGQDLLAHRPSGAPEIPNLVVEFLEVAARVERRALKERASQAAEFQKAHEQARRAARRIRRLLIITLFGLACAVGATALALESRRQEAAARQTEQAARRDAEISQRRAETRGKVGFRMGYYAVLFVKLKDDCQAGPGPARELATELRANADYLKPDNPCETLENLFSSALIWAGRPARASANLNHKAMCRHRRAVEFIERNKLAFVEGLRGSSRGLDLPWQDTGETFDRLAELAVLEGDSPMTRCR